MAEEAIMILGHEAELLRICLTRAPLAPSFSHVHLCNV